jgi:hypothetical protein
MKSSDCVAKENECNDSDGNRVTSSPIPNVGEPGADGADPEGCLDTGGVMFRDVDLWVVPGLRTEPAGNLGVGCWRIRRRPEAPRPCSCSDTTGDLMLLSQPAFLRLDCIPPECLCPSYLPGHPVQLSRVDTRTLRGIHC